MDFTRLFDLVTYQGKKYPNKRSLCIQGITENREYSNAQLIRYIDQLSIVFIRKGFKKGDVLALFCTTGCPEWNIVDFAAMQIGMTTIALHENYQDHELKYVISEIDAKACFVSHVHLGEKLQKLTFSEFIFCLEERDSFESLISLYQEYSESEFLELTLQKQSVQPEDLATIVYTSGSTGMPKGVMLSHDNIVSNIKSCISLIPINYQSVVASFLPLSHIFERTVNYTCLAVGSSIWYIEDKRNLLESMQVIKPNFMTCVPKVLEKNYAVIQNQLRKRPFLIRKILEWAMSSGQNYSGKRKWSPVYLTKKIFAEILLYRKWRKMMGGRLKFVGVGGAALDPALGKLYSCAGIHIREGYGMTECSPVISFNRFEPGGFVFGTVGIPVPGVDVKIDQANENGIGEILVKGPNLMQGYFKNAELTKEKIQNGWFHTGDLGQFVNKRFLKISGRKKNMFKTSSGRYIVPERIENILNKELFVEHSFVIGDGKAHVAAFIVPEFSTLKNWANENGVHWTAPQYMVLNPKVETRYQKIIDSVNIQLKSEEHIKKIYLVHDLWQVESGELTPTLKIKREILRKKYQKEIENIFSEEY